MMRTSAIFYTGINIMQTKVVSHWTVKHSLKLSNPGNGMEYVDAANLLKIQYFSNPESMMQQNTYILF